jgi:hypothetical protein
VTNRCHPRPRCGGATAAGALLAALAVIAAAVILVHAIWWPIAGTAAAIAASAAIVVLLTRPLRRWERQGAAMLESTRPGRLATVQAARDRPPVTQGPRWPEIEYHVVRHHQSCVSSGPSR